MSVRVFRHPLEQVCCAALPAIPDESPRSKTARSPSKYKSCVMGADRVSGAVNGRRLFTARSDADSPA
jgi:hypothetical protein